ncbi:MAG: methionyl-tRNA formyltransferase [Verrucomicrobiota bacterium]
MEEKPKVIYFGSDAICLPGLRYLADEMIERCELVAVISQPDRRQGRGKKLQRNPVAEFAAERGIRLMQPEKPDRQLGDWVIGEKVALAFVMAYGHFLPKFIREAPLNRMVNFHGSILPAYRGASPVETAIAEGETETGVCLMEIVKEMDAGGVADCEKVSIGPDETSREVRLHLGEAAVPLIERNFDKLINGAVQFIPQVAPEATFCRKITKEDGAIDFTLPAKAIRDRLRGFTPWPGAYFDHGGNRIRVGRIELGGDIGLNNAKPGEVLTGSPSLRVATGDGVVQFEELQRTGGRMLPASDFLRGYPIAVGEMLEGRKAQALVSKEP